MFLGGLSHRWCGRGGRFEVGSGRSRRAVGDDVPVMIADVTSRGSDDDFVWSRLFLAVMAVGFLAVAGFSLLASSFALDPEDEVPPLAILAPAGIAACALGLAALGGRVARTVSAVLGAFVVVASTWILAGAEASEWFSGRLAIALFAGLVGLAAVGLAAVVVAVHDEVSSRRETVRMAVATKVAGSPNRWRQILSWLIVAGLVAIAAGTGWWWLRTNVLEPHCGPVADAQVRAATQEMRAQIPGLRFSDIESSCDSSWDAYAIWQHDDVEQLLTDARAAGCVVNERALSSDDDEDFLTCSTSGTPVVFVLDVPDSASIGGSMTRA